MARPPTVVTPEQIAELEPALRRYVARDWQSADVDDFVQEALTRLMEVADRLEPGTLVAYGLATVGNLARTKSRQANMEQRHRHRLLMVHANGGADEGLIGAEQQEALSAALAALPPPMRTALVAHYGLDASDDPTTTSAARLARARARLRVEMLLRYRRVKLPTGRCRPVLIAISERDARQQRRTGANRHLLSCRTCAALAEPLLSRDRRLVGVVPFLGLPAAVRAARAHPVGSAATAVVASGAIAAGLVLTLNGSDPAPPTSQLCRLTGPTGDHLAGTRVSLTARVTGRPGDEGFYVTACGRPLWVRLVGSGESPITVHRGDVLSLRGRVELTDQQAAQHARLLGSRAGESRQVRVQVAADDSTVRKSRG